MSFREKSAWITLISVILTFGSYYGALGLGLFEPFSMSSFHLGMLSIIALVLLQVALTLIAHYSTPKDSRGPRDERERLIEARSHTVGYYVMMVGMVLVVGATHMPGLHSFMTTVYLGVGVMVIAAIAVAVSQIVMFRRGY
jgi:uncharacterized membrane protein